MNDKQYTIKDIAKMAGVSAGTVDRVLHNRGEVSANSREKIQKILDGIDYQPNVFAIGLAGKKKYTICCLFPVCEENDYWYSVAQGINKARAELRPFNVNIEYVYYEHSNLASYREASEKILELPCDAMLVVPNFGDETRALADELKERNLPFVFIDVNVEKAEPTIYIGQDSHRSGYIAGHILMREYTGEQEIALFVSGHKEKSCEVQMQSRLNGFMDYINSNFGKIKIHKVMLNPAADATALLDDFFIRNPQANMGVVFNSRIYQVGEYLKQKNKKLKGFIGYDLLPKNVALLKDGYINYLIGQRPSMQGYCGIKELANKIVFKLELQPVKFMPIDILMKENIDYYLEMV